LLFLLIFAYFGLFCHQKFVLVAVGSEEKDGWPLAVASARSSNTENETRRISRFLRPEA